MSKIRGAKRVRVKPESSAMVFWGVLALIAVTLIVYAPAWHFGFLEYDDPLYVSRNAEVSRGLTSQSFVWAFTTSHAASWHPLTWLAHMLDAQLFGMAAGYHHLTNILLHLINTLLLFWALRRMTGSWRPSAFVAALFAVHPLHVESVAWIAERKDVLSTLFLMLALHAYASYVRSPRLRRYLMVVAAFALGLMAKSMLVTLPFVLLLLDIWPLRRVRLEAGQGKVWAKLAREKIPLVLMALAASVITFIVQLHGGTVLQLGNFPISLRVENALVSYSAYIVQMLWPAGLAAYYPFGDFPGFLVAASLIALTLISFLAIRFARQYPWLLVGWLLYLITLAPVIGLVQVGGKSRADRFTYVPLIGLFIIAAWGIPKLLEGWRHREAVLYAGSVLVICALTAAARNQVGYWQNDLSLWEHTVRITGPNYFARHNLGMALIKRGDVSGAAANFIEALRVNPHSAETHNALSDALLKEGHFKDALAEASEAIRLKPGFADAHSNRGSALARLGNIGDSIAEFREALRLDPGSAEIRYNLGFALELNGRNDEAVQQLREALKINPSYADAYNKLGDVFQIAEKPGQAIKQYECALRLKPDFPEAHNNLGFLLMNLNRYDEAAGHFREALRINPEFALAHNNLGLVLINLNQSDQAVYQFREALRIQPGWTQAINNLGVALMDCQRDSEAAACFSQILRMNPSDAEARKNLRLALANRSRPASGG